MRPGFFSVALLALRLAAFAAGPDARKLSVAQIVAEGNKLDGATVEVHGNVNLSREISSFGDDSKCSGARKEPCKLSFAIGDCKVSGTKYAGLKCTDALFRLARESGFPMPSDKAIVIADVTIVGRLSTSREAVAVGGQQQRRPPAPGFGHFGIFPAEFSATEINLDKAVVKPLQ